MSMCCCMCEKMETAQSFGDDTQAVVERPKWASEHQRHTACGPSRAPDATHRQRKRKKEMREEKYTRDDSKKRRNSNFYGRKIKT